MGYSKYKGKFTPKNPMKYKGDFNNICYRSLLELRYFRYCDRNPSILKWNSEETIVGYYDEVKNKNRRYYVDLWLKVKINGGSTKEYLVEIKPKCETVKPRKRKNKNAYTKAMITYINNQNKWDAATAYAKKHGQEFIILTEKDI